MTVRRDPVVLAIEALKDCEHYANGLAIYAEQAPAWDPGPWFLLLCAAVDRLGVYLEDLRTVESAR